VGGWGVIKLAVVINYRGIPLLPTAFKNLSNILLLILTAYVGEIIGNHEYGFRRNRSTAAQSFCIHQILEKKWSIMER
jgi:hypothetical protein